MSTSLEPPTYVMPPVDPIAARTGAPVEMLPAWDLPTLDGDRYPAERDPCPSHAVDPDPLAHGHPWLVLEHRPDTIAVSLHHCPHTY